MLRYKYNKKRKRHEWALVARSTGRILQWFGVKKPSKGTFDEAEQRVQYFKAKNA